MRIVLIILGALFATGAASGAYWYWFGKSRLEITSGLRKWAITRDGREFTVWVMLTGGTQFPIGTYDDAAAAAARVKCEIENPNGDSTRPSVGAEAAGGGLMPMRSTPVGTTDEAVGEAATQAAQLAAFNQVMAGA
jgi:hypothetical protein